MKHILLIILGFLAIEEDFVKLKMPEFSLIDSVFVKKKDLKNNNLKNDGNMYFN